MGNSESSSRLPVPRSLMFVPGSRPDMVAKLTRIEPDLAVVDLEDAVPPSEKETARKATVGALAGRNFNSTMLLIRINPAGSSWFFDDLAAAATVGSGVLLPKYDSLTQVDTVRNRISQKAGIVVGLESAHGVAHSTELLGADVDAVYFGAEDYIADVGGRRTESGTEVLYARSAVCLAARLAGVTPIDQAVVSVHDDDGFRRDASEGLAIGYQGKICVHPRQVELAHETFTPSLEEVEHARAVLHAAENGVAVVSGQMVDEVHVRMARAVLARLPREQHQ